MLIAHCQEQNWGDALNKDLFKYLAKNNCSFASSSSAPKKPHILGVGSILGHANEFSEVWGSGFIAKEKRLSKTPAKICAVRGPLTRLKVLEQRIECPPIYGDPALLYPAIYNPDITEKYEWGFIPHYVDAKNPFFRTCTNCLIINIRDTTERVINQIKQCKYIASSSLHGLIAADAYKKPNVWIKLSNRIHGGNFKFHDYFQSVHRWQEEPLLCDKHTLRGILPRLIRRLHYHSIGLDLRPLIEHFPRKLPEDIKKHLISYIEDYYL